MSVFCNPGSVCGVMDTHQVLEYCDSRIKEDIQDINDDTPLQMILVIEPKTYRYICIDTIRMV